ncbi:MAG: DUF4410 domain-containing protein [Candidatus Binataceae bacterium]|jgi:hypothetical protein
MLKRWPAADLIVNTQSRFYVFLAFLVAGCAGASVTGQQGYNAPLIPSRPTTVYVYNFAVNSQEVTLNQSIFQRAYRAVSSSDEEQSQTELADETAQALAKAIVEELQGLGFTATQVVRGQQVSGENILIVDGQFVKINEGNRLRRMVIGLGVGESTLDTQIQVYQMVNGSTQQLMNFATHADSGQMPGAAFTAPAGAAVGGAAAAASLGANLAAGAGKTYTSGMGFLAKKTADEAVAYMSQFFGIQAWIPQSMVQKTNEGSSLHY